MEEWVRVAQGSVVVDDIMPGYDMQINRTVKQNMYQETVQKEYKTQKQYVKQQ